MSTTSIVAALNALGPSAFNGPWTTDFLGESVTPLDKKDMKAFIEFLKEKEKEEMNAAEKHKLEKEYVDTLRAIEKSATGKLFSLIAPETLTTESAKGFSKTPHIGGEAFVLKSAYLGKRGNAIGVFVPQGTARYLTMEMAIDEAVKKLSGFSAVVDSTEYRQEVKSRAKEKAAEREAKANAPKFDTYQEFGSW